MFKKIERYIDCRGYSSRRSQRIRKRVKNKRHKHKIKLKGIMTGLIQNMY